MNLNLFFFKYTVYVFISLFVYLDGSMHRQAAGLGLVGWLLDNNNGRLCRVSPSSLSPLQ